MMDGFSRARESRLYNLPEELLRKLKISIGLAIQNRVKVSASRIRPAGTGRTKPTTGFGTSRYSDAGLIGHTGFPH
jgi:hypothetical protein